MTTTPWVDILQKRVAQLSSWWITESTGACLPVPVNDCYAALEWVDASRRKLGLEGLPLVVAGDSAGGNLSAVMAIRSRDENGPEIALQALIYPVTDGRMGADSFTHEDKQLFLTTDIMAFFWDHYADHETRLNPMASPALTESLEGLPLLWFSPQSLTSWLTRGALMQSNSKRQACQ